MSFIDSSEPRGYCKHCVNRIGRRRNPCAFCGAHDPEAEPKQSADAPSAGLVPMTVYFPRDVFEAVKARTMSMSTKSEETRGFSEFVVERLRRVLAG